MCGFVENSFQNLFSQYRFSQIGTLELTIKVNFHSSTQPMYHVLFRTCYHYDGQPHGQTFILLLNMVMLKSIFWYLDGGIRLLVISSFFFVFTKLCVIVLHDWMVKEYNCNSVTGEFWMAFAILAWLFKKVITSAAGWPWTNIWHALAIGLMTVKYTWKTVLVCSAEEERNNE